MHNPLFTSSEKIPYMHQNRVLLENETSIAFRDPIQLLHQSGQKLDRVEALSPYVYTKPKSLAVTAKIPSKGCQMTKHSFRSLWVAHHALQEEAEAMRLRKIEPQRRLRRQESLTYELRTDLEPDLESEQQSKKRLQGGLDQQQHINKELRGELEDREKAQNELHE